MSETRGSPQIAVAPASEPTALLPSHPPSVPRWLWNAECRAEFQGQRIPDAFLANRQRHVSAQDLTGAKQNDSTPR